MEKREKRPDAPKRERKERTLADLSVTVWLTPENASFFMKNGFLYIKLNEEEKRAFLCRQFPQELPWEFISVLNDDKEEVGIIRRVELFSGEEGELLRTELERRYYTPLVEKIHSMKERHGFSYWKVTTPEGNVEFTLKDTFRSILKTEGGGILLLDVNGNRFRIPDVSRLDKKSYKKIELYL